MFGNLWVHDHAQGMSFVFYLLNAITLYKLSEKASVRNSWLAFIPVVQFILFFHILDKSAWNVLWILVPIVNIVFLLKWTHEFYLRFGTSSNTSIIIIILSVFTGSIIGKVFEIYLAFSDDVRYIGTIGLN